MEKSEFLGLFFDRNIRIFGTFWMGKVVKQSKKLSYNSDALWHFSSYESQTYQTIKSKVLIKIYKFG
jgi:hypothetical protein